MKIFKKYRTYLIIFIVIMFAAVAIITMKSLFYDSDLESLYGDRLQGVESVRISSDKKTQIINQIEQNEEIDSSTIEIKGKIINFILRGKEELTESISKKISSEALEEFSDDEKDFYDFQIFVISNEYKLIGYKNTTSEDIVWTKISEVDEDEKQS